MRAFIDSNIFLYAAQAHPEFGGDCKRIIAGIERGEIDAVTSTLNISEVGEVVARYVGRKASMEVLELLLALPMGIEAVEKEHLISAIEYFREYPINYFDCVYLALMKEKFINSMITNDRHFEKVDGINVVNPKSAFR